MTARNRLVVGAIEATLEIDAASMDDAMKQAETQLEAIAPGRQWSINPSVTPCVESAYGAPLLWHFEMHCTSRT